MKYSETKRVASVLSAIGAIAFAAACGSSSQPASDGSSGATCTEGGSGTGGASNMSGTLGEEPCVTAEGNVCAPSGFPFVQRAFPFPEGSLTQPQAGTLCMTGPGPDGAGFPLILFKGWDRALQPFDADALGITQLSFTIDPLPPGGVIVGAAFVARGTGPSGGERPDCPGDVRECLEFGFELPRITDAGTTTAPLTDFLQSNNLSGFQTFDTSSIAHIGFSVGEGPFDFCVRDLKFLNAAGVEVKPTADGASCTGDTPASGGSSGVGGTSATGGGSGASERDCTASTTTVAPADGVIATFMGSDGGIAITGEVFAVPGAYAPTVSTADGALHITENAPATSMPQYEDVLLAFDGCLDASAFSGVEFSISGSFSGCTMQYATGDVAHQDRNSPATYATGPAGSYQPQAMIAAAELTSAPQTLRMPFVGGPSGGRPAKPIDKSKLILLEWQFTVAPALAGTSSCIADVSIDDVKFY